MSEWIKIGKIGRPKGVRGHFYIAGRNEPLYDKHSVVMLGDSSAQLKILEQRHHNDKPYLLVESFDDRTKIETVRGKDVFVRKSEISVDDDEYLWDDLVGMQVVDNENTPLGKVVSIYNAGASDIIAIESADKSLEIPFVEEYFDFEKSRDHLVLKVNPQIFVDLWVEK